MVTIAVSLNGLYLDVCFSFTQYQFEALLYLFWKCNKKQNLSYSFVMIGVNQIETIAFMCDCNGGN